MYNTGNYMDLISIDFPEVREFIISPEDEVSFFNCNMENLVSLRDYLLELKKKKEEYDKLIEAPLKSIQEKNPWCIDVQPAIRSPFIMKANAKNYPSIYMAYEDDDFYGNGIRVSYNPLIRYLDNKRWNERRKIIKNSKDELLEIKKILESFGFKSENDGLITLSSRFLVIPRSFEEIEIQKRPIESLYIHRIKLNKNNEFYSDYCGLARFNDKDGKKYADSFIKKLYLTKK